MANRRESLWKKVQAVLLQRHAVRMLFIGPEAPLDTRIEEARKSGTAQPMPAEFLEAVKAVLEVLPRKEELFSQIKEKADQQMSDVWKKLWKTPEGKQYEVLKADVDRRKEKVNSLARKLEDGIYRKVATGGRLLSYVKASVIVSCEDAVQQATADIQNLKAELEQAKIRLRELQKAKTDQLERVNVLVVEEAGRGPKAELRSLPLPWGRRLSSYEDVAQAIVDAEALDELAIDSLEVMEAPMTAFIEVLQGVATQEATDQDIPAVNQEVEEMVMPVA